MPIEALREGASTTSTISQPSTTRRKAFSTKLQPLNPRKRPGTYSPGGWLASGAVNGGGTSAENRIMDISHI
jgi:hypothetical protein